MNDDLLKKIYEEVIVYEAEAVNIRRGIEDEVKNLMTSYASKLDGKEKEAFEDMCYNISYFAEFRYEVCGTNTDGAFKVIVIALWQF